jgi:hypothetical protein
MEADDKILDAWHCSLGVDFAHTVCEMATSRYHAMFAIRVFLKQGVVQKVFECYSAPFQERFPVPAHVVDVLFLMKHEQCEVYRFHAMY